MPSINADIELQLQNLDSQLREMNRKFDNAFGKVEKKSKKTSSEIETAIKGAFAGFTAANLFDKAIRGLTDLAIHAKELADSAKGVVPAFERLDRPGLLRNLVESTGGTVSNLELMRQAVRASNFEIPVKNLGKLFQFAAIRAKETGESVDFLVNSIISGIGRKSPLILDNLGISAVRLRKELKGVGVETADVGAIAAAVGGIIDQEMEKAGVSVDEVVGETERLNASFENLALTLGQEFNPSIEAAQGSLADFVDDLDVIVRSGHALTGFLQAAKAAALPLTFPLVLASNAVGALADSIREAESIASAGNTPFADLIPDDVLDDSGKLLFDITAIQLTALKLARTRAITEETVNKKVIEDARREAERLATALASVQHQIATDQSLSDIERFSDLDIDLFNQSASAQGGAPTEAEIVAFAVSQEPIDEVAESLDRLKGKSDEITAGQAIMAQGFANAFGAITDSIAQGEVSLKAFAQTALQVAQQVINAALARAIAESIASQASKGLFGLITAGIAVAGIRALFNKEVPKLAIGTNMVQSDGLAQLHRGEAVVPAAVAAGGFTGGTQRIEIVGKYDGRDIYLANKRAADEFGRIS